MSPLALKQLSICPCGYNVLNDDIQLGKLYTVDLNSINPDGYYRCGGCGLVQENVLTILALQSDGNLGLLPYGLFEPAPVAKLT